VNSPPLTSFPSSLRVAVIGASGGIGSALIRQLSASPRVSGLYALSRSAMPDADARAVPLPLDLRDEKSIEAAAARIGEQGPLQLVVVATGVLHRLPGLRPERSWRQLQAGSMAEAYAVNTIGPALVAKHFLDLLAPEGKSVFAVLSARVGSIEDNRLGGWHSYRASKAALHQVIRTCAIELSRRNPHAICVALHPGTVDTPLSRPFQANVPAGKLFSAERAATQLLQVMDGLQPASSGQAFAWDGERLPF
jgi:NAD(P)-dependent dehydrogenase (short-subunit alcohol dehydrogenase family)